MTVLPLPKRGSAPIEAAPAVDVAAAPTPPRSGMFNSFRSRRDVDETVEPPCRRCPL